MSYVYYNPNPKHARVGDCTIRAISKAMGQSWESTYAGLTAYGYMLCDMPSSNAVWGAYLRRNGYKRFIVDDHGKDGYTVSDFCNDNPDGVYVLCVTGHVLCVDNGDYFDTWDSGDEIPLYYWKKV